MGISYQAVYARAASHPNRDGQPRGGIARPLDHERQRTATVGAADHQPALVRRVAAWVAHRDVGVTGELMDLLDRDRACAELVDRRLGQ
jgi:hypothetical protein